MAIATYLQHLLRSVTNSKKLDFFWILKIFQKILLSFSGIQICINLEVKPCFEWSISIVFPKEIDPIEVILWQNEDWTKTTFFLSFWKNVQKIENRQSWISHRSLPRGVIILLSVEFHCSILSRMWFGRSFAALFVRYARYRSLHQKLVYTTEKRNLFSPVFYHHPGGQRSPS